MLSEHFFGDHVAEYVACDWSKTRQLDLVEVGLDFNVRVHHEVVVSSAIS